MLQEENFPDLKPNDLVYLIVDLHFDQVKHSKFGRVSVRDHRIPGCIYVEFTRGRLGCFYGKDSKYEVVRVSKIFNRWIT